MKRKETRINIQYTISKIRHDASVTRAKQTLCPRASSVSQLKLQTGISLRGQYKH